MVTIKYFPNPNPGEKERITYYLTDFVSPTIQTLNIVGRNSSAIVRLLLTSKLYLEKQLRDMVFVSISLLKV